MAVSRTYRPFLPSLAQADLPPETRRAILARQNGRCFYCEQPIVGGTYVLDHVIPRNAGGDHGPANRVAAHPPCDLKKAGRLPTEQELNKLRKQILESLDE